MNTINDEYYQRLKNAYESNNPSVCFNTDKVHNAIVMCFMLDSCSEIKMFCKHMSVFREHFYDKINDVDSKELKESVKHSLKQFLERPDSKLSVITIESGEFQDFICKKEMSDSISTGKVSICTLAHDFAPKNIISHFTVADDSVLRLENDVVNHGALCSFHNKAMIDDFNFYFKTLMSYTTV